MAIFSVEFRGAGGTVRMMTVEADNAIEAAEEAARAHANAEGRGIEDVTGFSVTTEIEGQGCPIDIDVGGRGEPASPGRARQIVQLAFRGVIRVLEREYRTSPELILDGLLSAYVSLAIARIGIDRTIEGLGNTREALLELVLSTGRAGPRQ